VYTMRYTWQYFITASLTVATAHTGQSTECIP
jgi:hypothetical protein